MRKFVIAVVGLLGFALVFFAAADLSSSSHRSTPQTNASDASNGGGDQPSAMQVSVPELYRAYHANEVAADNEYKGKRLYVEGLVGSINKNFADQVYLTLPTYDEFGSVQAVVTENDYAAAAQLHKGMVVAMECDGHGMILDSPMLGNCSFVSRRESPPRATPSQPVVSSEPAPESTPTVESSAPAPSPVPSQADGHSGNVQSPDAPKTEDATPASSQ